MEQGERYLARESEHKRLSHKERSDSEASERVIHNRADDAEAQEILDRGGAILEVEVCGEAESSIRESGDEGPDAPAARHRIVEDDTEKSEHEAS